MNQPPTESEQRLRTIYTLLLEYVCFKRPADMPVDKIKGALEVIRKEIEERFGPPPSPDIAVEGPMTRCAMCDEWYDPHGERAKIHEHQEPQSGPARDSHIASGLPYEEWVKTQMGAAWAASRSR